MSSTNEAAGWPIFGRDAADVAWRPDPEAASATRLAGLLRLVGEPDLTTLQAHAAADPAWFWSGVAEDLALPWQRRPTQTLDLSGGIEWARWWTGGAFNYAVAAVDERAARDPDGEAIGWEGDDGEVRRLSNAELRAAVDQAAHKIGRAHV